MAIATSTALMLGGMAAQGAASAVAAKKKATAAKKAAAEQEKATAEAQGYTRQSMDRTQQMYSPYLNNPGALSGAGPGATGGNWIGRLTTPGPGAKFASPGPGGPPQAPPPQQGPPPPGPGQAVPRGGMPMGFAPGESGGMPDEWGRQQQVGYNGYPPPPGGVFARMQQGMPAARIRQPPPGQFQY